VAQASGLCSGQAMGMPHVICFHKRFMGERLSTILVVALRHE